MNNLIQIFKLNEPRPYDFTDERGKSIKGVSHSAECALLTEDRQVDQVGRLPLKGDDLIAAAVPGIYTPVYSLRVNPKDRVIAPVLVGFIAVPPLGASRPSSRPVEPAKA